MDPYAAPPQQQQPPRRPQSRAVAVLAATLCALIVLWIVGAILLIRFAPDLGKLPGSDPSTDAPQTP